MGKKLTRFECNEIAAKLFKKSTLVKSQQEAADHLKVVGQALVRKYVPKELFDLPERIKGLIRTDTGVVFSNKQGSTRYLYFSDISSMSEDGTKYLDYPVMPVLKSAIVIPDEDYHNLYGALEKVSDAKRQCRHWQGEVAEALYTLGTLKKIQEAFPEAVEFFPDSKKGSQGSKALVVYDYSKLRKMIQKEG